MPVVQLVSIQVGLPQCFDDSSGGGKAWTSAIIKTPVDGPVVVDEHGLAGDGQADLENHGGIDKAVLVYCQDHFDSWRESMPEIPWQAGAFGENFTLHGVNESEVCVGDVWSIGECQLEISQPRQPCWKLSRRWGIPKLAVQVQQTGRTGWYCRVRQGGVVQASAEMTLVERRYPDVTIQWANQVMYAKPRNTADDRRLADCAALSESWRQHLTDRQR